VDFLSSLSQSELEQVRYHSDCHKKIVNKPLLERAEKRRARSDSDSPAQPAKRGRPAKSSAIGRPQRHTGAAPKMIVCIFTPPSGKCKYHEEELHKVASDNCGQRLLDIKAHTMDDHIRASLSSLHQPGDAHAQEKWYHSSCLQDAHRTCSNDTGVDDAHDDMMRAISDVQIVMHVKSSLMSNAGLVLNMAEINNVYMSILKENNIENLRDNQRKYLKKLLSDRIPNITFVQPPQKNESERVLLSKSVGEAVDYATMKAPTAVLESLLEVTSAMRAELLNCRYGWKFSSDSSLSSWKNPPLTQLFLTHLWYGPYVENMGEKRDAEVKKCVEVGCQFIVQNTHTDRQVKHKPKYDTGFVHHVETPLSIGLPLTIHQRVRDKNLVRVLSSVYLGTGYEHVLNITKHIEHAVVLRMTDTGGYCLPDFIKKGITVFFAVDNIDFVEDTPYGQSTLHGTLIVVYQEENENAEPINPPLAIPDKPPSSLLHVEIKYKDEPVIQLKPIKFTSYTIGQRAVLLKPHCHYDETWALANHLANDIDQFTPPGIESPDTIMAPTPGHDLAPNSEDVVMAPTPDHDLAPSNEDVVMAPTTDHDLAPSNGDVVMAPTPDHDLPPSNEDVVMEPTSDHDLAPSSEEPESADTTSKNIILEVMQKVIKKEN
jgi:hypothetical protein